jgi:multicomponent Na+:H+ antiporter subunit D
MKLPLVLPILVPLFTAILCLLASRSRKLQRILALGGGLVLLGASVHLLRVVSEQGIQAVQIGGWPAPYGITLVADLLSAIMIVLAGIIGLAGLVFSLLTIDRGRESFGYYALFHILLTGVCGAFLTGDIFNLYVWFEVMLIASFVLLALGGERPQLEGAIKYVALNLMSSAFFLAAVGILYGLAGTLNMADLAQKLQHSSHPGLITTVSMLFLAAFGIKAAVFPMFFWLPASYHVPPVAVSAVFAGLLTKVGVYALIRVFTLIFRQDVPYTHTLILIVAALTMVTGVLGAAAQSEFRRILSFHIVSQIGYMIMGLGLLTPWGLAGSVLYLTHHIIVKTNLFLVSGWVQHMFGSGELKLLGGVYRSHPLVAVLFLVPAMSLAGLPPLSGFFAKLTLIKAGLEVEQYAIVATALGVGLLTMFSMTKIWAEVFWKPRPASATEAHAFDTPAGRRHAHTARLLLLPIAVLSAVTITIGLGVEWFTALSLRASEQLLDPAGYIQAVLGDAR